MSDWICPFCPGEKVIPGTTIYMHVRNKHPRELEAQTWDSIRSLLKHPPKPIFNPTEAKKAELTEAKPQETGNEALPPTVAIPSKEMQAWTEQARKQLGFYPSPATLAIINTFSKSATDPSDFVNEAVINEGKRRGVSAAIITTEGGQSMEIMKTGKDEDQDFDRLIKLLTVSATVNQSYSPNTPLIQMIQAVKDRVNKGMPMQDFLQILIMMKELEREPNKQGNVLMPLMFMSRFKGRK
jgi:hypothetical protein